MIEKMLVTIVGMILTATMFAPSTTYAAPKSNKLSIPEAPMAIQRGQTRRLFIVGFEGMVNVSPSPKADEITVRALKYLDSEPAPGDMEALSQLVIKAAAAADTLEIRAQLPPNAADWAKWAQGKRVPKARLDITAPENMGLEIYLTRGDVKVPHWKSSVVITSQDGHIAVQDVTGEVTVHSMYGSVKVDNIHGPVTIENFNSQITANNITGKLKIKNFSGETHVKKVAGNAFINSQKGGVFTQDTIGSLEIQTGVAAIHVGEHKGSITGHSDAGAIHAKLVGPVDARLNSATGPLTLVVPRSSEASVSMYTGKGNLSAPSALESKRSPSGRSLKGQLNGREPGHIRLSSEEGDLVLKTL